MRVVITYLEFFKRISVYYGQAGDQQEVSSFSSLEWATDQFKIFLIDAVCLLIVAVIFTILRRFHYDVMMKVAVERLKIDSKNSQYTFIASSFKTSYYLLMTLLIYFFLFKLDKGCTWNQNELIFEGWSVKTPTPLLPRLIYLIECGFYLHSLYAIIFMPKEETSSQQKDFYPMIIHHLVTVTLMVFSHILKFYKNGLLVLACHDINDVFLEFAKTMGALRRRNRRFYPMFDHICTGGTIIFVVSWIYTRLYLFPLKVIYSNISGEMLSGQQSLPMVKYLNTMLLTILFLDLYWFTLIVKTVKRRISGKRLEDVRDNYVRSDLRKNQ
ncbi:hypothetical protein ACOME3_001066 [Neoechinorhynchus agilis]